MTDTESNAIQAKAKSEMTGPAELTKPGPVFKPAVDIFETDKVITLLADMPGVKAKGLNIDLKENILALDGDVEEFEDAKELDVLREYRTGKYYREFTLSQKIDQSGIEAKLNNGVLRLTIPKVEATTPRKITVKS